MAKKRRTFLLRPGARLLLKIADHGELLAKNLKPAEYVAAHSRLFRKGLLKKSFKPADDHSNHCYLWWSLTEAGKAELQECLMRYPELLQEGGQKYTFCLPLERQSDTKKD